MVWDYTPPDVAAVADYSAGEIGFVAMPYKQDLARQRAIIAAAKETVARVRVSETPNLATEAEFFKWASSYRQQSRQDLMASKKWSTSAVLDRA